MKTGSTTYAKERKNLLSHAGAATSKSSNTFAVFFVNVQEHENLHRVSAFPVDGVDFASGGRLPEQGEKDDDDLGEHFVTFSEPFGFIKFTTRRVLLQAVFVFKTFSHFCFHVRSEKRGNFSQVSRS